MSEKYTLKVSFEQRNQIIKVIDAQVETSIQEFINSLKWSNLDSIAHNEALQDLKLALEAQKACVSYRFEEEVEEEEE